ncbi:hypothetical protein GQ55_8G145500 [Panicum hallii var. hallii]|uniref:Uncharacterized protein n=1 Tax=Panicum hallii var. hallii TaxID=1504633 RepID=A0A2T7CN66_9POAL|nr:hypothetical protein GQ55_8G145500 [Panicum hallii var. hallii]
MPACRAPSSPPEPSLPHRSAPASGRCPGGCRRSRRARCRSVDCRSRRAPTGTLLSKLARFPQSREHAACALAQLGAPTVPSFFVIHGEGDGDEVNRGSQEDPHGQRARALKAAPPERCQSQRDRHLARFDKYNGQREMSRGSKMKIAWFIASSKREMLPGGIHTQDCFEQICKVNLDLALLFGNTVISSAEYS